MAIKIFQTNNDRLQQEYEKSQDTKDSSSGNTGNIYKLKKGITVLRVLPPWSTAGMWYKEFYEHYIFAGGQGNYFNCLTNWKKNCPLCLEGKRLYMTEDEDNVENSKKFRPRRQFLLNALVLSEPGGSNTAQQGVQVVQVGSMVKDELLKWDRGFALGWGDMTDLRNGFDISVEKQGEGLNTRYPVTPVAKRTNIVEVLASQNIDFNTFSMNDLDAVLAQPTVEELQEVLKDDYVPYFPSQPEPVEVGANPGPGTTTVTMPVPENAKVTADPVSEDTHEDSCEGFPVPAGVEVESDNMIPVPEPFKEEV